MSIKFHIRQILSALGYTFDSRAQTETGIFATKITFPYGARPKHNMFSMLSTTPHFPPITSNTNTIAHRRAHTIEAFHLLWPCSQSAQRVSSLPTSLRCVCTRIHSQRISKTRQRLLSSNFRICIFS